jgi:small subunit ribosomal protein S6
MKRKYEAMIVLDTKGKEESAEQLVSQISQDMEKAGLKLEQIDHLGKRKFPTAPRHVEGGHFVSIQFQGDTAGPGRNPRQAEAERKRLSAILPAPRLIAERFRKQRTPESANQSPCHAQSSD